MNCYTLNCYTLKQSLTAIYFLINIIVEFYFQCFNMTNVIENIHINLFKFILSCLTSNFDNVNFGSFVTFFAAYKFYFIFIRILPFSTTRYF